MPFGPYYSGLPTTGSPAKAYVDQTSWNLIIDNFLNWKGNVNGGGFTLSNVIIITGAAGVSGSASLTFPAIPDGGIAFQTFTLTGSVVGDSVIPLWPSTLETGLVGMMYVSAANTVKVVLENLSGASVTPAVQSFGATVGLGATPLRAALSFGAIADGAIGVLTFTAAGATTANKVSPAWPSTLEAGLVGMMYVSSPNTITVRLANLSGASITLAAGQVFGASLF